MTVMKQTQVDFRQRVRRIAAASQADRPRAQGAHRPVVNALAGAGAAVPLYAATGPTFGPNTLSWLAWLPAPLRDEALMLVAAAIGAALVLLLVHGLRLVMRRGTEARNSAAALTGASTAATALMVFTTMPDAALAGYADVPLDAVRAAVLQVTQVIPGLDVGRL
ncbi:hypothetical protein [Citreimonas salinaria]|nr:hypothetical protein [Citreimonas salinaria]